MPDWTPAQKEAIFSRGCDMLVSAGAGSGKTAVLKERIVRLVADCGARLDEMVVLTFTNAAAGEMRERILCGLEKEMEGSPNARHIREQAALAERANISTIHSFCATVLRRHFAAVGLDPAFRVAEEGETALLRQEALDALFEELYEAQDPAFLALSDMFEPRGNGGGLEQLVLDTHAFALSSPEPERWLREAAEKYKDGSAFFAEFYSHAKALLARARILLERAAAMLPNSAEYAKVKWLMIDNAQIVRELENTPGDGLADAIDRANFGRITAIKSDPYTYEKVKEMREQAKKIVKRAGGLLPRRPACELEADIRSLKPVVESIGKLVLAFDAKFAEFKRERGIVDFSDLEHMTLAALKNGCAEEYRKKIAYIFIDEYQDISGVQQAIIDQISRGGNVFMVGDVKQSIYRFRLAEPELFMKYSELFGRGTGEGRRIDLNANFRSKSSILRFVNKVFENIMREGDSEITYGEAEKLTPQKEGGELPELILIESGEEFACDEEQEYTRVARREAAAATSAIRRLVSQGFRYSDIAVLMRSVQGYGQQFAETLAKEGIPVFADFGGGYLDAPEVNTLTSLLHLLDNRRQDVHLLAVMRSAIGGFSEDELAQIRIAFPEGSFYSAAVSAASGEGGLAQRLQDFLKKIEGYKQDAAILPVDELIAKLLDETGFADYCAALPGGEQRRANLDLLLSRARQYQAAQKGLWGFLRYLKRVREHGVRMDAARAPCDDVVRLMTIHKSKGLEFGAVILTHAGKQFNLANREDYCFHKRLGIGLTKIDVEKRVIRPTVSKLAVDQRLRYEGLSEEMRMLYVAMTRAEERLIIIGSAKNVGAMAQGDYEPPVPPRTYLDWLAPSISEDVCHVTTFSGERREATEQPPEVGTASGDGGFTEVISWRYGHEGDSLLPAKIAASRAAQGITSAAYETSMRVPRFVSASVMTPEKRGTIYHLVMQKLDYARTSAHEIQSQIAGMIQNELLTPEDAKIIDAEKIAAFFRTGLGMRLKAAETVLRELPFNLALQTESGEVLVQGIIDCCIREPDGFVLVDYKTDHVMPGQAYATAMRHAPQLEIYGRALEAAGYSVKQKFIYLFEAQEAVEISGAQTG